jgi:predicted nucleotidyltransferase
MVTLESIKEIVIAHAQSDQTIAGVYIFGSVVSQRLTSESDIDVGILFEDKTSALELMQLQQELSDAFGMQADVVNLDEVSPILRMQVLKKGVCVFARNKKRVSEFFIRTINEYDDLKRMRKPIEESIQRGRIYA